MSKVKNSALTITEIELARGFIIAVDSMSITLSEQSVLYGAIPERGRFGHHKHCGGEVWRIPTGEYIARAYCKECGTGVEIPYYIKTIVALGAEFPGATVEVDPLRDHSG